MIDKSLIVEEDVEVKGNLLNDVNIKDGNLSILKETEINQSSNTTLDIGASNINSVKDSFTFKYKFRIEGSQGNQVLKIYAVNRKTTVDGDIESLEEVLQLSKDVITYKVYELHHDHNSLGAGSSRPENPKVGRPFFDTVLQKPIWFTGLVWVDAMGNEV